MSRHARHGLLAGLIVGIVAAVGAVAYVVWLRTAPPLPATLEQSAALIESPRYRRLDDARRSPYLQRVRELVNALPPQERLAWRDRVRDDPRLGQVHAQVMQDMMVAQARAYVAAAPAERQAMLDRFIQMIERRGEDERGGDRRRDGDSDDGPRRRMRAYLQHGDPQSQAFVQEFWKAVRARRAALGLAEPDQDQDAPRS